jgi:hypothetical protein
LNVAAVVVVVAVHHGFFVLIFPVVASVFLNRRKKNNLSRTKKSFFGLYVFVFVQIELDYISVESRRKNLKKNDKDD